MSSTPLDRNGNFPCSDRLNSLNRIYKFKSIFRSHLSEPSHIWMNAVCLPISVITNDHKIGSKIPDGGSCKSMICSSHLRDLNPGPTHYENVTQKTFYVAVPLSTLEAKENTNDLNLAKKLYVCLCCTQNVRKYPADLQCKKSRNNWKISKF